MKTDSESSDYDRKIFPVLANEAQQHIAKYGTHIVRKIEIKVDNTPYKTSLPEDFYRVAPMGMVNAEDETAGVDYHIAEDNFVIINDTGKFLLYYWALPRDITKIGNDELDNYEYEIPVHTHIAIPSYIGYQLVKTDDVQLAQILLNEWNKYLSLYDDKVKAVKRKIRNCARWW